MTQDEKYFPQFWELAAAFGRGTGRFYPSSGTMIERITSGEHLLGFNVIGSYVVLRQRKDPDLGLVYPTTTCWSCRGSRSSQERQASERRQAVHGLSLVRPRAEDHGEPGDAVLAA